MTPLSSEAERLAAFVMRMQTRLGSCRESCNEYDKMAWDDYDQAASLLRRIPELESEMYRVRDELDECKQERKRVEAERDQLREELGRRSHDVVIKGDAYTIKVLTENKISIHPKSPSTSTQEGDK